MAELPSNYLFPSLHSYNPDLPKHLMGENSFMRTNLLCCMNFTNPEATLPIKSGIMWVKILAYLDRDEDSKIASQVCLIFRTIINIKRLHQLQPVFPLEVSILNHFSDFAALAKTLPPFRMLQAAGVVKTAPGTWEISKDLYKAIQLVHSKVNIDHLWRVKAPRFVDRKLACIDLILANLRSSNRGSFRFSPKLHDLIGNRINKESI